ncbi:MAG: FtsX-like permease family protein [Actinobacteria bacterium]|nr:FtsX-like permease family protein [Actinomycetota bacterium]
MLRIAIKGALAKKLRLFSTALSVILGVAFLTGTLVFTDTIQRTFDNLFADVFAQTDSYVRSSTTVDLGMGSEQRGRMSEDVVDTIRGVPGVADVRPVVEGYAQLVDADGKAIGNPGQGAPTLGMSYTDGPMTPWRLTEGSRVPASGEVVIDQGSADKGDLQIGDTVAVLTQTGPHELPIVGIARFGTIDSPGGASVALFDLGTAQDLLLGQRGEIDAVMIKGADGVSQQELTHRVSAVIPDGTEALTGQQITDEAQDSMKDALGFFNTFLLVFAAIGLVVACFTIYNTFQIIISQRTHEMALLRALGATRRQVLWAQLTEAGFVGVIASVIGLGTGVLVAKLLKAVLAGFGIDIPAGGTVFLTRTAVVAMIVGTGVTMVSAVLPSMRASRVPPIAAIRDVAIEHTTQSRFRLLNGALLTALGVMGFVGGLSGRGLAWVGFGALLTFLGVFVLGPLLSRPVSRVLGAPIVAAAGITGALARENAIRNPKRTARTGGALMVGVALVAGITVIAASAKDWTRDIFGRTFTGDFVVSTDTYGFGGLSPEVAQQLNALPEVEAATGIRIGAAHDVADDSDTSYIAVDPTTGAKLFDIGMIEGSVEALTTSGILVDDDEAADRDLAVGDHVLFRFIDGVTRDLTVQGIYTEQDLAGPFVISQALHEQTGVDQFDFSVYVATAPGVSESAAKTAIAGVSDAYPNADLESRSEYIDSQAAQIDPIVNLMYALLGLAVIIALVNIANSMALSIHERTRELGLLRAVGMSRHQTRASVAWEAVLVAMLGTGLGVIIGVFFGWAISVTIRDEGFDAFTMPWRPIAFIAVAAVLGGVLAAARPARRAARLDVLRAIATE